MNFWSKPIPKPPENPSDHFEPVSASPNPSRPILHRFYIFDFFFFGKKCSFFSSCFEVFPIFSLFLELQRLWDHSQIVDHIFLILTKKFSAPETQSAPHWWQNNVPKRSTKYFLLKYFLFFLIISWALEALGPLPNCRSHFCGSNRVIESFLNPQGNSFVTKQCSKNVPKRSTKYF